MKACCKQYYIHMIDYYQDFKSSPSFDVPVTLNICKLYAGLAQKQTLRQGFVCKWFVWTMIPGRSTRRAGKQDREGKEVNMGVYYQTSS